MDYQRWYADSLHNSHTFWSHAAQALNWITPWKHVYHQDGLHYEWFVGGELNISVNCLDRHIQAGRGDKIAYHWIDEDEHTASVTYAQLLAQVERAARALQQLGLQRGDRLVIYMPHTIEHVVVMLASARLGLIHSVVFAGFSAAALQTRLLDTGARALITATWTQRRGKKIDLLSVARTASTDCPQLEHLLVWDRDRHSTATTPELIHQSKEHQPEREKDWQSWQEECDQQSNAPLVPVSMNSEDPLFILYTSGTTGKPKGIVHTTGGYAVAAALTTKVSFAVRPDDVYWCTADPGWITGHTYGVYGPLLNGLTSVIAEGAPDYPDANRWWQIIARFGVNIWYTAPTAVRLLMRYGDERPQAHDLSSLRLIGSVGEPINPAAWWWLHNVVGQQKTQIIDTWWQTETGAHMLVTLPHLPQKPGVAGLPFAGVDPAVVDDHGHPLPNGQKGYLVIKQPWPSALRTCWNQPERFAQYWQRFAPYYFTGDMAIQDEEGYIQVLGRSDDVLNVAGHRLGSAEVESALVAHPAVAEAAVIALPDDITGEKLHAFVLLHPGQNGDDALKDELRETVKTAIGRFAIVSDFTFTNQLPKTRSGKIMRRVLRAQMLGEPVGDTSTLEE